MKHLVKRQIETKMIEPHFRLEFGQFGVRAVVGDKILCSWFTNKQMEAFIDGFWEAFSIWRIGEKK